MDAGGQSGDAEIGHEFVWGREKDVEKVDEW
jgi:hypothetical protein